MAEQIYEFLPPIEPDLTFADISFQCRNIKY